MSAIQSRYKATGFSLVELITVVAVIVLMMSLLLPAISGFSGTAGRRGAVNILMNTFEQARVAALESGQNVYVGFADKDFPVADMQYAAFCVFRDATDLEKDPNGDGNTSDGVPYVVLKKWTRLPKNISFKRVANSLVPSSGGKLNISYTDLNKVFPSAYQLTSSTPGITYNSTGTIEGGSSPLQLFLYEGYYLGGQDNLTRGTSAGLFEKISFSRYTGRSQLDITTTSGS